MRPWLLLLVAAACQLPVLPNPETSPMFEGGDGLAASQDRVIRGTILEDTTLDADAPWILDGLVFVGDGTQPVELEIEPGTIIYGNPTNRGTLVVQRGSRIVADGTASQPIVFTSPRARGARAAGDWGGLVVNGYAPINTCTTGLGTCEAEGEGESGLYGGSDPDDDSGVLRYVRIEFAGALYTPVDELNGLALQGVGRGTTIEYVQLHVAADDGIEFFGGTVDVNHIVVTGGGDDSLDWTYGWSGQAQFVVLQQFPGSGDRAIEADNNDDDHEASPRSRPVLANLTLVGQAPTNAGTGVLLRRGTGASLVNSIVHNFAVGLDIDDDSTWDAAYTDFGAPSGEITFEGNWFDNAADFADTGWDVHTLASMLTDDFPSNVQDDPLLVDPLDVDGPNFLLDSSSPALTAAVPATSGTLEPVTYVGAFDADNDWSAGWTTGGTN